MRPSDFRDLFKLWIPPDPDTLEPLAGFDVSVFVESPALHWMTGTTHPLPPSRRNSTFLRFDWRVRDIQSRVNDGL